MCFTVTSDKSRPVYRDHNRKILQTDIMKRLVIRSLQNEEYTANIGFIPPAAKPAANVIACSSAIPTSKNDLGNALQTE